MVSQSADGITVSYLPNGARSPRPLQLPEAHRTLHFIGDQIRQVQVPDLRTIVSVTLVMTGIFQQRYVKAPRNCRH